MSESLLKFVETVLLLDANDDRAGLVALMQEQKQQPNELFITLHMLLAKHRLYASYVLARVLVGGGCQYPILDFALSIGGLVYGNPDTMLQGLQGLRQRVDEATEAERITLYDQFVAPVLSRALQQFNPTDALRIAYGFEILKAAVPPFRHILPEGVGWNATLYYLTPEELRRRGQQQADLLEWSPPPTGQPTRRRRVVVAMREFVFWGQTWPRPACVEPRLVAAMRACGWQVLLSVVPGQEPHLEEDFHTIGNACRQHEAELLILDENFVLTSGEDPSANRLRRDQLALLRLKLPSLQLGTLLFDAAALEPQLLLDVAPLLDLILDPTAPALPLWNDPRLRHKVLSLPMPRGERRSSQNQPLTGTLVCADPPTAYRGFWLQATAQVGLPVQQQTKEGFAPDKEWQLDAYRHHRQAEAWAPCHLQLAGDPHRAASVTDDVLDLLLAGSLLVREASPHMRRYFTPGEHYLEFSSLVELATLVRFIEQHREAAEGIRRAGQAFAQARYSDAAWVGALERFLSRSPAAEAAGAAVPRAMQLLSFEYISVDRWCRAVAPDELLTGKGNLLTYFHDLNPPQPTLPMPDLHLGGAGFESLIPADERFIGASVKDFDMRSRRLVSRPPFIARLENVRIEFPGFGLFLDRHLVMEESYHDKEELHRSIGWYSDRTRWYGMRRTGSCEMDLEGLDGHPVRMSLDVNCYMDRAVDQYEAGPAILLSSPARTNYHHWMVETLPRLWCLTAVPALRDLPLIVRGPLQPYQAQTLDALGITPERIRWFTGHLLQVETLIFPSFITPANAHGSGSLQHVTWLREVLMPAFGVEVRSPPERLLYISRRNSYRGFLNEEEIASQLRQRGFQIVCLEELTLREQITAFANARMVVMPHGAAGVNMLFVPPGTLYLELMPGVRQNSIHLVHAALRECHSGCILCDYARHADQSMVVNVNTLMTVVDKALAGLHG
ncbi:MAG: DUF563 domain-containing protein [Magnetococcales bacterium]|nr:DUF563 domain-containing protein [Magnetococcales bacterium]